MVSSLSSPKIVCREGGASIRTGSDIGAHVQAYATNRREVEMRILDKIQGHVSGSTSASLKGAPAQGASTLSQTQTRQRGDSFRAMEGMDADNDKLFKLSTR